MPTPDKTQSPHSPTPWEIDSGDTPIADTGDYDGYLVIMSGTVQVCRFEEDHGGGWDQADANAEHIQTCVNTHAALVDLAERVANFDCFKPWGVLCSQIGDSGEEPCEACTAKRLAGETV